MCDRIRWSVGLRWLNIISMEKYSSGVQGAGRALAGSLVTTPVSLLAVFRGRSGHSCVHNGHATRVVRLVQLF